MKNKFINKYKKWILEVWNDGRPKIDYDIHIDMIDKSLVQKHNEWLSRACQFFFEIEVERKKLDVDLISLLKLPLRDKERGDQVEITNNNLIEELDEITPPSVFLIDRYNLEKMKTENKMILVGLIDDKLECRYIEWMDEDEPNMLFRCVYCYTK